MPSFLVQILKGSMVFFIFFCLHSGKPFVLASENRDRGLLTFGKMVDPIYDDARICALSPFVPVLLRNSSSKSEQQRQLEEQLKSLLDELRALEKEGRNKFQKEILPYLKREIQRLRERLREFQHRKDEPAEPLRSRA